MKIAIIFVATFVFLASTACNLKAQDNKQQEPKTKIEAFEAQSGSVIIRGFAEAGKINGVYGGTVTVEAVEFTNAATTKKEYGVTIEVKETDRIERSHTSFVDYDEIDGLIKGIEYISKIDKSTTRFDSFQADYRTKGEVKVSTFSSSKDIMASVESGSIGSVDIIIRMSELLKFRDLITTAKAKIDSVKPH